MGLCAMFGSYAAINPLWRGFQLTSGGCGIACSTTRSGASRNGMPALALPIRGGLTAGRVQQGSWARTLELPDQEPTYAATAPIRDQRRAHHLATGTAKSESVCMGAKSDG